MCDGEVYAITFPPGFQRVHLEMINILVVLRIWGEKWRGQDITIHCDNEAVVYVLNSGPNFGCQCMKCYDDYGQRLH